MNESLSNELGWLTKLDETVTQFEKAWNSFHENGSDRPAIEQFIHDFDEPKKGELFRSLLRIELDIRSGEDPRRRDYEERFPGYCDTIANIFAEQRTVDWKEQPEADRAYQSDETLPIQSTSAAELVSGEFGRFQLEKQLGRGGFGAVWLAYDPQLDRQVALKLPRAGTLHDDDDVQRFLREGRAAAQLRHPHIVPIHDAGEINGTYFIAGDFIEGTTLRQAIRDKGRFEHRDAAALISKLASALDYAHIKGIVHRDVKPENVMIDADGEPQIVDFGLARREEGDALLTQERTLMGTPAYMSPEQAKRESHLADGRSDLWSLGVMLYELLAGKRPFDARGSEEVLLAILQDEPQRPRKLDKSIPKDLETICQKCLEKEPEERYPSCQELADELQRWLKREPIKARRISSSERSWRWCRRNPVVASLTSIVVLVVILGVSTSAYFIKLAYDRHRDMTEVSKKLDENALEDLKTESLQRAQRHYESKLKRKPHDPLTNFYLGVIYEVLKSPQSALRRYQKAYESQNSLVKKKPNDREHLETLGDILNAIGRASFKAHKPDQSRLYYQEALELRKQLRQQHPNRIELQRKLANAHMNLGVFEREKGNKTNAKDHYDEAQSIRNKLLQLYDDPEIKRDVAMGCYNLGNLHRENKETTLASKQFKQAIFHFKSIQHEPRQRFSNRYRLAICHRLLGDLQFEIDLDLAEQSYNQAKEILPGICKDKPNVPEYSVELARLYYNISWLRVKQTRHDDALKVLQQSLELFDRMVRQASDVEDYRVDYVEALLLMATLQDNVGEIATTLDYLRERRNQLQELVKSSPNNIKYQGELEDNNALIRQVTAETTDENANCD